MRLNTETIRIIILDLITNDRWPGTLSLTNRFLAQDLGFDKDEFAFTYFEQQDYHIEDWNWYYSNIYNITRQLIKEKVIREVTYDHYEIRKV